MADDLGDVLGAALTAGVIAALQQLGDDARHPSLKAARSSAKASIVYGKAVETLFPARLRGYADQLTQLRLPHQDPAELEEAVPLVMQIVLFCMEGKGLNAQMLWVELADFVGVDVAGAMVCDLLARTEMIPVTEMRGTIADWVRVAVRTERVPSFIDAEIRRAPPISRRRRPR